LRANERKEKEGREREREQCIILRKTYFNAQNIKIIIIK